MTAKLYLGNARYSSWSLRGWLMVHLAGLAVEDVFVPMGETVSPAVKAVSPSGLVPYLEHEGARVWDSLAIAEYCAEQNPALWPAEKISRAHARAISAEIHSGFPALRRAMPMNLGRSFPGHGHTPEALGDVARIEAIWEETRAGFGQGGPYLFGAAFTAADAMFAPVVARFLSHTPPLRETARAYCAAVRAHPLVANWHEIAAQEPATWLLDKYETLA